MDENDVKIPGLICKSADISAGDVTEADLAKINKYTLEPVTADQVFTFKAVMCDNAVDRTFERFSESALKSLQKLYIGKTVIKDHRRAADNQIARIYDTELVKGDTMPDGEQYTQLVAHCYMIKTASNADMIAEIKGGIRKEGSISCSVEKCVCSVCGADNRKAYCMHYNGRKYDGKLCYFTLDGVRDAYEFSLVAVPAQRAAGITKSYTGTTISEKETVSEPDHPQEPTPEEPAEDTTTKALMLRARLMALRARTKEE